MEYTKTLMYKEIGEAEQAIRSFRARNASVIENVVKEVKSRGIKHIQLAARGTSDHALLFFKYAVEILTGLSAGCVGPSVVTMYGGKVDFGSDLVIGCSQSGHAADVIAVVERTNAQGGVTLAITNDEESPLAKAAKYHLNLGAGKEVSVAATKTFTVQLYALLSLAVALGGESEKYADLADRLGGMLSAANELTEKEATRIKDMKDGFVLARGITYAIAFESALKLQETSKKRMRAYAMSDFYHGPMEMVNKGTHVIIYAPSTDIPDLAADRVKCVEKMLSFGADVTLVTDDDNLALYGKKGASVCRFPRFNDEFEAMFGFAFFAQLLACRISCLTGLDPDNPKALNKITVTR